MANNYFRTILLISFVLISNAAWAQLPPPPPGDLPIDGGIISLLVLAVGYGVKKIHDNLKK